MQTASSLTHTERAFLKGVLAGRSVAEIAGSLRYDGNAREVLASIRKKYDLPNIRDAVAAIEQGTLPDPTRCDA